MSGEDWRVVYLRPSVLFTLNSRFAIQGGVGFFQSFRLIDQLEIRPWQGLLVRWPKVGRVSFQNLVRLEERLLRSRFLEKAIVIWRLRYKLSATIPLNSTKVQEGTIYVPAYVELFTDLGGNIPKPSANRLRLSAGIGYKMPRDWAVEFSYIHQQARGGPLEEFLMGDHVFRIQFKH